MANPMVVDAGFAIETNLLSGLGGTVPKWTGWGTGVVAPVAGDTTLGTASSEARTVGTLTRVTTTKTNDTLQDAATIASTQTQAITEVGTFDALTSGNLSVRGTFTAINVVNLDSIAFTIKTQET